MTSKLGLHFRARRPTHAFAGVFLPRPCRPNGRASFVYSSGASLVTGTFSSVWSGHEAEAVTGFCQVCQGHEV